MIESVNQQVSELVALSKKIIAALESNVDLGYLVELTQLRDVLVSKLSTNTSVFQSVDDTLLEELKALRQAEQSALQPYRKEAADCQQVLIKLKQMEEYLINGL